MLTKLKDWIEDKLSPPPLSRVVEHQMEEAELEVQRAQHVITTHRFQEHMARARIEALEDWHHGRNLRA